ncbi:MAG: DUF1194 domain-containing protein [Shimia sp.]
MRWLLAIFLMAAGQAKACSLALLFAVDVSGSVDPSEYRIQMDGLAAALRDPAIAGALVEGEAALALMQWTGASRQRVTLDWTRITDADALERFARAIEEDPRVWRNFSTAIGEALAVGAQTMARAPLCDRRVIDVSGDGDNNEGPVPGDAHAALRRQGVTVNALVIEDATVGDLTGYFFENVITGENAFVETANGFADYPARIRLKLLREVVEVLG